MTTFDRLQSLFLEDLRELQQIQKRRWLTLPMTRVVKEEHLGRCCYLAEELLCSADLNMLKQRVGLNERQWRIYKARISAQ
jgi:hypothetical protein